jgi:hypothetical protein
MVHYFFDLWHSGKELPDETGADFPNLEEATSEALTTLGEMARDCLRNGDRRDTVISIREEGGPVLVTASLTLHVTHS